MSWVVLQLCLGCVLEVSRVCLDYVLVVFWLFAQWCPGGVLIQSWLRLSYLMAVCKLCLGCYVLGLP